MKIYQTRQQLKTRSIYDIELRVVYYARVSTEKEEQKNSTKNQISFFEEFITKNKQWRFCGGYVDDGISGIQATKREEFQRMIADARNGRFDLVVTKEISRFARNTLDSIEYTRKLLSYGVCVWFVNDNINTVDEDSEFRLTIMAGVAQDEVRKLSSRVKFGHAQAIKSGVVLGNSHIYGWDKEKGRLSINEKEAAMVRIIYQKYATGEWSTRQISDLLYDLGYRNYKGGRICKDVIKNIIRNPKYKGWYAGGKVKVVDMFTKKQEFIPPEKWHMFEDDGSRVPAIIDSETWEKANQYLLERSNMIKSHRSSYKNENIFTGKIFCANDGAMYWLKSRVIHGHEDIKWVCSHKLKYGSSTCSSFYVDELELKKMLVDMIRSSVQTIDGIVEQYWEIYSRVISDHMVDNSAQIQRLNREIDALNKKKDKILDYSLNGIISDQEFARRNNDFNEQIKSLEEQVKELSHDPTESMELRKKLSCIKKMIREYADITTSDITKTVVNDMIERINITPIGDHAANIEFILKNGATSMTLYDKNHMIRSDYMFKKMIAEQEKKMAGK